jgi:hypothetical protein
LRRIRSTFQTRKYQPDRSGRIETRSFLLIAAALLAFGATKTVGPTVASAAVCADGVVRAGCAGPRGAVVVKKRVKVCRTVIVNGVKVRRCT